MPLESQVCWTVELEHSVVPGTQLPVQLVPTHAEFTHGTGAPHVPPEHVCNPLPEHSVIPALQLPLQAPAVHMFVAQLWAVPQVPSEAHVSTPVPEQRVVPGAQTPVQALAWQTYVHDIALPHAPFAPHVSSAVLLVHCVAPGVQPPVHAPMEQAWLAHGDPTLCHMPVGPHSCGCCPLQPSEPGTHCRHCPPLHTGVFPMHAWPRFCHCPLAVQNWGDCMLHCTEPGTHPASPLGPESLALPLSPLPSCPESCAGAPESPTSVPLSPWSSSATPLSMPRMEPHPIEASALANEKAAAARRNEALPITSNDTTRPCGPSG